jgi:hypothetical protein
LSVEDHPPRPASNSTDFQDSARVRNQYPRAVTRPTAKCFVALVIATTLVLPATSQAGPAGQPGGTACTELAATQPAVSNGNFLLNCDFVGPHFETPLAVDPTDASHILAGSIAWQSDQISPHVSQVREVRTDAYLTRDGGATWADIHLPLGGYQGMFDPNVALSADGRAYYSSLAFKFSSGVGLISPEDVVVNTSADGGATWTKPVLVGPGAPGAFCATGTSGATCPGATPRRVQGDAPKIAIDNGPASPFRGDVYVTWTSIDQSGSPILFSRSLDGGSTWSTPRAINGISPTLCSIQHGNNTGSGCIEDSGSQIAVSPSGTIYVTFVNTQRVTAGNSQILFVRSTDGGATWTSPVSLTPLLHDSPADIPDGSFPGCSFGALGASSVAVSAATANSGQLYVAYADNVDPGGPLQARIFAVTSTNDGRSWSAPAHVNNAPAEQFQPAATVGQDGRLRVGYYDQNRAPVTGDVCDYGYTLSTAATTNAASFGKPRALETAISRDPNLGMPFSIGDYTALTTAPDGTIWAAWTDNRDPTAPAAVAAHTEP